MRHHLLPCALTLLLLGELTPTIAQAAPPSIIQAEASMGATAKVEVHTEYIQGEPILIPIQLHNPGPGRINVPDLATRPWLVHFQLVLPTGHDQLRKNSAPDEDHGTMVSVAPRGNRHVLLEIPSSRSMKPGDYEVQIDIQLSDEVISLPSHKFSLVSAIPTASDFGVQQHPGSASEMLPTLWVHRSPDGHRIFLHQADGKQPQKVHSDQYLHHIDDTISPLLSVTRSRDLGRGHVIWEEGPQTLNILRLDGNRTPALPQRLSLPWPKVELESRGWTTTNGQLHIPIWIPAPQGNSGTIHLIRLNNRGQPSFERLGQFERRPTLSLSILDDAGQPHLLLVHSGNVDRYSPRIETTTEQPLPVPGKRLLRSRAGHKIVDLQLVALPDTDERAGAMAILLTSVTSAQLHHTWISLAGTVLQQIEGATLEPGQRLARIVADGWSSPGHAIRTSDGSFTLIDRARLIPFEPEARGDWQLYRSNNGTVHFRQVVEGGPVYHKQLGP